MRGRDVEELRHATVDRLAARGLDEVVVPNHDKFTHAMAIAVLEAQYWMGLRSDTYLKTKVIETKPRQIFCTQGAQSIVRLVEDRDADQRHRAEERRAALDEGPRYWDDLVKAGVGQTGRGADAAVRFAISQIGAREDPFGSNWGGRVEQWIKLAGYVAPVPWCGCFANACVIAAGVPNGKGWIGYTPAVIQHARAGVGGWRWVGPSDGKRGMLALFDTPGGDPAVHIEIVEERRSPSAYGCIGGNTTPKGMSGSQANGGAVGRTDRSTSGYFHIVGFAVPPY
jgi:hypothetical protein